MTGGTPKGQLFRDLLTSEKPLVLLGAYDALGARLIAQAGGKSLFIGGFSIVGARYGVPDVGLRAYADIAAGSPPAEVNTCACGQQYLERERGAHERCTTASSNSKCGAQGVARRSSAILASCFALVASLPRRSRTRELNTSVISALFLRRPARNA